MYQECSDMIVSISSLTVLYVFLVFCDPDGKRLKIVRYPTVDFLDISLKLILYFSLQ